MSIFLFPYFQSWCYFIYLLLLWIASWQTSFLIRTILNLTLSLFLLLPKQIIYLLIIYLIEADTYPHHTWIPLIFHYFTEHTLEGPGEDAVLGGALVDLVTADDGVGLACTCLPVGEDRAVHDVHEPICQRLNPCEDRVLRVFRHENIVKFEMHLVEIFKQPNSSFLNCKKVIFSLHLLLLSILWSVLTLGMVLYALLTGFYWEEQR